MRASSKKNYSDMVFYFIIPMHYLWHSHYINTLANLDVIPSASTISTKFFKISTDFSHILSLGHLVKALYVRTF